jgi:hypothetical protein
MLAFELELARGTAMSIQEHRRIIFGLPALREALQIHLPEIAPALVPRGAQVKSVVVVTDPLSARIRVLAQGAAESTEAEVSALQIGAVLIRRCKTVGIPLPRNSSKALEADPQGVAMTITLPHEARGQSQLSTHRISA